MPTNLDDFNKVSPSSQLTHQNLLSTLEKLFPNQDSGKNNLKCEIAPTIDSIDDGVNKFRKSPRTQFSLVLCNGKVENQVDPQSGQRFSEATGGNHWTTLHFRKDQNGQINAFYADSLNANSTTVPKQIEGKLKTLGIEASNIHKMKCQSQGINQCGDYSAFNAKAMDQMSLAELKTGSIKQNITLANGNNVDAQNFSSNLRQDLMAEFNGDNNQRNSLNDSYQKQFQTDSDKAKLLSEKSFLDEQFHRDMARAISLSEQSFSETRNNQGLLDILRKEQQANQANQLPSQEQLKDQAINAQAMIFQNQKGSPIDRISTLDRGIIEDIALKLAIENSLKDNSQNTNKSQNLRNVPVYQLPSGSSARPNTPVYGSPSGSSARPNPPVYGSPSGSKARPNTPVYGSPSGSSARPVTPPPYLLSASPKRSR